MKTELNHVYNRDSIKTGKQFCCINISLKNKTTVK